MGLVRRGILWGLRVPGTTQADWNLWQGKSEGISRYQAGVAHLLTWNMQCHPIMNFPTLTYLLWQGKNQLIKPCLPLPLPCNLRILEYLSRSPSYFLWGNVYQRILCPKPEQRVCGTVPHLPHSRHTHTSVPWSVTKLFVLSHVSEELQYSVCCATPLRNERNLNYSVCQNSQFWALCSIHPAVNFRSQAIISLSFSSVPA